MKPLTLEKVGCMLAMTPGLTAVGEARRLQDTFVSKLSMLSAEEGIEMVDANGEKSRWQWDERIGAWQKIIS